MEMAVVNDALNVRRGMMRAGSPAQVWDTVVRSWGDGGLPVVIWGWRERMETETWCGVGVLRQTRYLPWWLGIKSEGMGWR